MAFNAVIHYPNGEEDRSKLMEDMVAYRIMLMREYHSKLETGSGNKIKIADEILKDKITTTGLAGGLLSPIRACCWLGLKPSE